MDPFQVSGLLQCSNGSGNARLQLLHLVVPSCLPRDLQGRIGYALPLPGHRLHRLPYFADLVDIDLRLVQQDKMLPKVIFIEQHIAIGPDPLVPSGPPRLLHVILQRVGDVIVDHHSHIVLVDTHPKSRCGHHDIHLTCHECILVHCFLPGLHLAVVRERLVPVV